MRRALLVVGDALMMTLCLVAPREALACAFFGAGLSSLVTLFWGKEFADGTHGT